MTDQRWRRRRASAPAAGELSVLVQFQRQDQAGDWADIGAPHPARRRDLRADERWRSGTVQAGVEARFTVRHTPFASTVTPRDRLVADGEAFEIVGVRDLGRRRWIEITAASRTD